jgi:hypothetical protein
MTCPHGSRDRLACPDCADEPMRISTPTRTTSCLHPRPLRFEGAYDGVDDIRYSGLRVSEYQQRERLEWAAHWCPSCGSIAFGRGSVLVWRMPDG